MKEWDIGANCYRKRLGMLKIINEIIKNRFAEILL